MNIIEYFLSAVKSLSANKMRSFLTMLGIIVGISSVILINTVGNTLGSTIENLFSSMVKGEVMDLTITFVEDTSTSPLVIWYYDDMPEFTEDMLEAFEDNFSDNVSKILCSSIAEGKIKVDEENYSSADILACSASYSDVFSLKIKEGHYFTESDVEKGMNVAVISDIAARACFGREDVIGEQVEFIAPMGISYKFTVVGVYEWKPDMGTRVEEDERKQMATVCVPYTFDKSIDVEDVRGYYPTYAVYNIDDKEQFKEDVAAFFKPYLGEEWRLKPILVTDQMDDMRKIVDVITTVIAVIAAISLIVGSIGVMNVMLVSVTERTMEIGVRKALGASNPSIRIQFIIEAILIALTGSVLGIVTGLINAKILAMVALNISAAKNISLSINLDVPYGSIIGAVIFSFAVGLIFGVYPANKAAHMEVVDALRYE